MKKLFHNNYYTPHAYNPHKDFKWSTNNTWSRDHGPLCYNYYPIITINIPQANIFHTYNTSQHVYNCGNKCSSQTNNQSHNDIMTIHSF